MMSDKERMTRNIELMKRTRETFHKLFGFNLEEVFDAVGKLDVEKFDRKIGTPEGVATSTWCTKQYGLGATTFVRTLL